MNTSGSTKTDTYRDTFRTAGDLRGAAYDLCEALRGGPHYDLAVQIHDSICKALPQYSDEPIGRLAPEPAAEPVVYGVIVTSKEAKSGAAGNPVVTEEGERFWATVEPEGWVEASSSRVRGDAPPGDPLIFKTPEGAESFAKRWKGHPWWCVPGGQYEIVPLVAKTVTDARITGYRRLSETKHPERSELCPNCLGLQFTGIGLGKSYCKACNGTGRLPANGGEKK